MAYLHIFPTRKQLLCKFWSFFILNLTYVCRDLPSKLAKKQIFRYHKLYDIIYIIYYISIRMYIYILYLSPIDFSKKHVGLVNFPQPNFQPENLCQLGGGCAWVVKFR